MSDVRADAAAPAETATAPPRHPNSSVEPHSDAARATTHVDLTGSQSATREPGFDPAGERPPATVGDGSGGDVKGTELLQEIAEPSTHQTADAASPEVTEVQLEHAGPAVLEELAQSQPHTLLVQDASDPIVTPVLDAAGEKDSVLAASSGADQELLGPPSPNLYGEPTPPPHTAELPASPLLGPDPPAAVPAIHEPVSTAQAPTSRTSPRSLQIRTLPAELASPERDPQNLTPTGSVPSTPISPSGGDAGHDGAEEDNLDEDDRPIWSHRRPDDSALLANRGLAGNGAVQDGMSSPSRHAPRETSDGQSTERSEDSDAVEALHPAAISQTRTRPTSSSQPPPFNNDLAQSAGPSAASYRSAGTESRAQHHGRSQSVVIPGASSNQQGTSFQTALSSATGPPSQRSSDRYRASSATAAGGSNGRSAPRSPSSGAAPSSPLARETSLRASSRSGYSAEPPSRQGSVSTNGRSGNPPPEGQSSRSTSRRTQPGSSSGGDAAAATQSSVHGARSRRTLGEWQLTKTLGAGSMGKVKLGVSSVTGEKVSGRRRVGSRWASPLTVDISATGRDQDHPALHLDGICATPSGAESTSATSCGRGPERRQCCGGCGEEARPDGIFRRESASQGRQQGGSHRPRRQSVPPAPPPLYLRHARDVGVPCAECVQPRPPRATTLTRSQSRSITTTSFRST